jgi:hypothetical protein
MAMVLRKPFLVALALGSLVAPASAQQEQKPAIEIKTRAVEIAVTIDPKLKRYPPLEARILAGARKWVAEARATAAAEYKTNRRFFTDGRTYDYARSFTLRSYVTHRYVSVLTEDHTYTGGAHPNTMLDTLLWDQAQKKYLSIRPFFKETADNGPIMTALMQLARRAVAAEKIVRIRDNDDKKPPSAQEIDETAKSDELIAQGVLPTLLGIGPISLAPSTQPDKTSGLTFHYSPYAVDAYVAGPYTVFVSWRAFASLLSPEGVAIFGGERTADDEKTAP